MASSGDLQYSRLLKAIDNTQQLIQELEAEPQSPKRDNALDLLRHRHGQALRKLSELESNSHQN